MLDYWLSLRAGKGLPHRADFNPVRHGRTLARLCLFDAKPDAYVRCRVAGSTVVTLLDRELTVLDYRAVTPPSVQASRLRVYEEILGGLGMRNIRAATLTTGRRIAWQELVLPSGDIREDGAQPVLVASDFPRFEFGEHLAVPDEALGRSLTAEYVQL